MFWCPRVDNFWGMEIEIFREQDCSSYDMLLGEWITILIAYTDYRHLG